MDIAKWIGSQRYHKEEKIRKCYTFRPTIINLLMEVPSFLTDFDVNGCFCNRNGDVELSRSFETSLRAPKMESVCKSYDKTKFEVCWNSGRKRNSGLTVGQPALGPWISGLTGRGTDMAFCLTRSKLDLNRIFFSDGISHQKSSNPWGIDEIRPWERKLR